MCGATLTWRLLTLFVLTSTPVNSGRPVYKREDDEVVLTPAAVDPSDPITSVMWRHGDDIAVEWYGKETLSFRQFKDRSVLNTSTGGLTITGLTRDESGNYTVEINSKALDATTQLLVISPVPKPNLTIRCEPDLTYCLFTCEGNTTGAEPITYWWRENDMVWNATKVYNRTKTTEPSFACRLQNPVSTEFSDSVQNPFINSELPPFLHWDTWSLQTIYSFRILFGRNPDVVVNVPPAVSRSDSACMPSLEQMQKRKRCRRNISSVALF